MKNLQVSLFMALSAAAIVGRDARAAGFALYERSVSGLGNAFAGAAAVAEDASTV